ncbi:AAA family ATPase [Tahibacter sp. UC22_41]|uniref:AAA family ATPase n=1 Tax=Tahibacter sp. UC22_41 TaxID=3350178 RepID=UPI0036DC851C
MLKSITIRRFKNIENLTVPLGRVNVLVGTNNSGKSSVLQSIAFAVSVAQTSALHGGATTLAPEQLIYAPLRDVMTLGHGGTLRQPPASAIEVDFTLVNPTPPGEPVHTPDPYTTVNVRRGKNANLAIGIEAANGANLDLSSLAPPYCIYVPGLAGIPAVEPYRTPAALRRAAARGDANSVLRNVLLALYRDDAAWQRFLRNLADIFPGHRIEIAFDPERDEAIDANVVTADSYLPLDASGTGLLQAVQILAYAAKDTPPLLLLDEPDAHLHPDKQRRLIQLLSQLAEAGDFQVIIATHSRHVIDALQVGANIHWMSNGMLRPASETDLIAVLTELGALDKGDRLRAGQTDVVLLTEDTDPKVVQPLLEAAGFHPERIEVWSYATCTQIAKAQILAEFIRKHAPGTEIIVHSDRDYRSDEAIAALRQQFLAANINLFVTDGTDAESHFLSTDHIIELYPNIPREEVDDALRAAHAAAKAASESRLARELVRREIAASDNPRHEPNPMAIADQARNQVAQNPGRWIHGKSAIGPLIGMLQRNRGGFRPLQPSQVIRHTDLLAIVARLPVAQHAANGE